MVIITDKDKRSYNLTSQTGLCGFIALVGHNEGQTHLHSDASLRQALFMPMQHIACLPWWQYHIIDAEQRSQPGRPSQKDPGVAH